MIDAIILAGGKTTSALALISQKDYEAEIDIAGQKMINYVIDAVKNTAIVERIVVVGPPTLNLNNEISLLETGDSILSNLQKGIDFLKPQGHVLIITCDIPLITPEAIKDFIQKCQGQEADIYYPVVSKIINEQKYPGVKRTYVKLKEGIFTGGNIFLANPQVITNCLPKIEQAIAMRKKPLQLCRVLGLPFFFKFIFGNLSITEIEKRIKVMLHFKGIAILSSFPEIGVDVDKPSDLALATKILADLKR